MTSKINYFPVHTLERKNFPDDFRQIPHLPEVLYYRGSLPDFHLSWIAMVGTRRPSPNAETICQKLIRNLQGTDAVVLSGLAQGIDSYCHQSALFYKIPTVAVIAQGIELEIGGSRKIVAEKILESGGAIISEYPEKTPPLAFMFPQRNRIIAGLSKSVTLIESKDRGGGLLTVEYAQKLKRKILAVPGSLLSETAQGPNRLISQKIAEPVWNPNDFSDLCGARRLTDISPQNLPGMGIRLSESAQKLFDQNAGFTHSLNDLCANSSFPISQILAILTELEIAGLVHSKDGDAFHFSIPE